MNTKSTFNPVFLNGKWLTTFGLILLGIGVLLGITVYSQALSFTPPSIGPAPDEAFALNPELITARRYAAEAVVGMRPASVVANPELALVRRSAAEVDQAIRLISPDANPELIIARRYSAMLQQQMDLAHLAANPELSMAHRSVPEVDQSIRLASQVANPELTIARRYTAVRNAMIAWSVLAANPEISLARRYAPRVHTSTAVLLSPLTQVQVAEAARYTALAAEKYNLYGSSSWTRAPKNELTRSQLAEAAVDQAIRLTSPDANPELIIARRYGGIMKAQLQSSVLSSNPELGLARRYAEHRWGGPQSTSLASNPELSIARRYAPAGAGE